MSETLRRKRFDVPPEAEGRRLDRWLAERMPDFSRSALQRLIRNSRVRAKGRPQTKCGALVRAGDTIEVELPPPVRAIPQPQAIRLDILYEDDALLVLNKPAGMVVHPAAGNREGTLVNALLHHCRGLSSIGGVERPGILHRLDKLTSGLLVVAKTDMAHRHLAAQLAKRTLRRTYLAVVWGQPQPPTGIIAAAIGRHARDRKRMAVLKQGGRHAVTHYRTVSATGGLTVLELSLETGRTHQIRVHLSHIGHPVVGDKQYGLRGKRLADRLLRLPSSLRALAAGATRQLLHARRIRFTHPVSGGEIEVEAPLPDDVARLVAAIAATPPTGI